MRVLHVGKFYLPYRGGIESHLHALCRELTKSISVNVVVANETLRLMTSEINESSEPVIQPGSRSTQAPRPSSARRAADSGPSATSDD